MRKMESPVLALHSMQKLALLLTLAPFAAQAQFAIHNGDRVVFYGDSITDQRLYTMYTEVYIRTRFPKLDVTFTHSGWGGDRVTGGGGGDIDTRISRDILPYHPTVVTIMLAMNDAGYRAFDQGLFDTFDRGYTHIVDRLHSEDPGVRLTLIQPSPYDDVTRDPNFPGGYNGTLLRYADFVKDLAARKAATVADLNTPMVDMLKAAKAKDPAAAQQIIRDRVHPGDAGHLVMAEALLKSWNAPSVVSAVQIDGGKLTSSENTRVSNLAATGGTLSWTQTDGALPFPLNLSDSLVHLVVDSSDFVQALDQQTLKVSGISGRYALSIDGKLVGTFGSDDLAAGINLATMDTPMKAQAMRVEGLIREREEVHNQRWRAIETDGWLEHETLAASEKKAALDALDRYDRALDKEVRKAAQPAPHVFTLVPSA